MCICTMMNVAFSVDGSTAQVEELDSRGSEDSDC
jgi:hypothetical protein